MTTRMPDTSSPPESGFDDGIMDVALMALLAGPANAIMQLARPGVGCAMVESRVDGGRIDRHPIKRARTTFTYLAVATRGSEAQKQAFRRAVNRAHAQVHSTPDSPVKYNAFDPELQLWVAACLYKGAVDVYRIFGGEYDEELEDRYYRAARALGTTLQVPPEMWPADRAAFDQYWNDAIDEVHIDDTVREYLYPIAAVRIPGLQLPWPLQGIFERFTLLITTGFLPQRFRDEMKFEWNPSKQQQFDCLMGLFRFCNNRSPAVVRAFPFNVVLRDLDWRIRTGRSLV